VSSAYNYDPFGRLNTVTTAGQTTQRYLYDGFDRIIEQHTDGILTQKSYDPLDRLATETTDAGGPDEETTLFTYLGLTEQVLTEQVDGQVTTSYQHSLAGQLLSQTKHDTTGTGVDEDSFYAYNPHGDVAAITNEAGDTRATYGYTAYGSDDESLFTGVDKPDPADPTTQEPYNVHRYAGQRWDPATDTYDMGFRDYSPGLNRFLTRDVFNGALADMSLGSNPWTMSRYTFAGGNPTTLVEYDGHMAVRDIDGGGASVPPAQVADDRSFWDKAGEFVIGAKAGWDNWGVDKVEGIKAFFDDPLGALEGLVEEADAWNRYYTGSPLGSGISPNLGLTCALTGACEIYEKWNAGDYYGAGYSAGSMAGDITVGVGTSVATSGIGAIAGGVLKVASLLSRTAVPDVASDLAAAATRANTTVGSGRGPVHGSRVHTAFRQEILDPCSRPIRCLQ
jgi:RHS repeat-associated protein